MERKQCVSLIAVGPTNGVQDKGDHMSALTWALILGLVLLLTFATVARHALLILPFIVFASYLYWNHGSKDSDESDGSE